MQDSTGMGFINKESGVYGPNENDVHFYIQSWQVREVPTDKNISIQGNYLLIDTDLDVFNFLKSKAASDSGMVLVVPGNKFRVVADGVFEINRQNEEDFSRVLEAIDFLPDNILYLWPLRNNAGSMEDIPEKLDSSIYPLFYISKLLMDKRKGRVRALYVYDYSDISANPYNMAVGGFARSIRQENPGYLYKTIGFSGKPLDNRLIAETLIGELENEQPDIFDVLYEDNLRKVKVLKQFEGVPSEGFALRKNGIYLITGGAGGLGLIFAKHIAGKNGAKVVLTGRSELTEYAKTTIEEIYSRQGEIIYIRSDISKKDDVFKLVKEIKNKYKAINGIIHAAGVIRDSFLIKKTKEEFQEVLLPKVYGSVWLDEATKDEELDFLVLFSSTVAVTGNVGQCDYAYANSFMDSFSEYRGALVKNCLRSGKTLSINWPLWKNGGMGIDDSTAAWLKDNMGILPLEDFEGCRTLDKALGYKTNRLTVFGGYREMIEKSINIDKTVKEQYEVKNGDCENLNTENIFEKTRLFLSDILAKELRIPVTSIKPDDAMEKLGIDSVMVMTLTRELEKYFGSLPKTLFFEYLSLKELVGYFVENHGEKLKKILVDTSSDPVYENHKQNNSSLDKQNERKEVTVNKRTRFLKGTGFERSCRGDSNSAINDDIAIIGISGRYPMADNLDEFWENLKSGKDCISEIPEERWDHSLYFDPDKDKPGVIYTKWGGFIRDVDKFDPLFFNISPREAELMDPQERLFLQTAWHTFEDAGYIREHLANTRTGVFAGVMYGQYQLFGAEEVMKGNMVAPGSSYATIANRVSYFFNLRGPSMAVDTMCSSSLTAIHLACQSIHKGEIEMALAGGVNVSIHPNKYLFLSQGKYASTDGRCRSFGEGGNGYVPGEGCGAVLLKPLKKAIKDRDTIYAVIKGSALNHGGKTNGYTVPNPAAQAELIMEAMKSANINAGDFGYIEAHGTGTSLGDPIELAGMVKAFSGFGIEKQSCPIGSVKSNVGHLEAAAGIVGITKIVLQMKYRQLVPSIHSKELNPNINFKDTPFYVQRELTDWNVKGDPLSETKNLRLAGISSFGAGGANAHIILQEYIDDRTVGQSATDGQYMIVLSAKNRDRLKEYAASLANFLRRYEGELRPDDVAYTLQVGREAMEERLSFFASSIEDIAEKLEKFYNNVMEEGVFTGNIRDSRPDVLPAIEEQEEYIKRLVSLKKYNELADMWINGAKLDWKLMYIELPRRISLPLYPFAKERYWIATSEKNDLFSGTGWDKLHSLIHKNISDLEEQKYKTRFSGKEFYLKEHKVGSVMTVPGAVCIEMAMEAAFLASGRKVLKINDIIWERPIVLNGDRVLDVYTSIFPERECVGFEIWTITDDGNRRVHSTGKLLLGEEHQDYQAKALKDIEGLKSRCITSLNVEEYYLWFMKRGLDYGSSFRCIKQLWSNGRESLAFLELSGKGKTEKEFLFHPALLDGSFQSIAGIMVRSRHDEGKVFLPYSVGEISIYQELPEKCYALAIASGQEDESETFDIEIMDDSGNLLASIKDFNVHAANGNMQSDVKKPEELVYGTEWKKKPCNKYYNNLPKGDMLVFDVDDKLVYELEALKNTSDISEIILVRIGECYRRISEKEYEINPSNDGDYVQLLDEISKKGATITKILHMWSLQNENESINKCLDVGYYSVFHLVKAMMNLRALNKTQLIYVYHGEKGVLTALNSAFSGFARTVCLENPEFSLKSIRLSLQPDESVVRRNAIANRILDEYYGPAFEDEIHFNGGERLVNSLVELEYPLTGNGKTVFRENGVYIITGGTGGIGYLIAKHIAQKKGVKLVLVGRTVPNSIINDKIKELKTLGAEVEYHRADVSDRNAVFEMVNKVKALFGAVHGVIHCAGITRDSFIVKKSLNEINEVLNSKIFGTIALDDATKNEKLDFFVMFSSLSGVIGNVGQSDYAFANCFIDNFAEERERLHKKGKRSGKTLSINWPFWSEGGMRIESGTIASIEEATGIIPLDTGKGISFFEEALNCSSTRVIPLVGNSSVIRAFMNKEEGFLEEKQEMMLDEKDEGELLKKAEKYLKSLLSKEIKLSVSEISSNEPMENYGIDSVMIMFMTRELEKHFGKLSKTLFFEYGRIADLTQYFIKKHKSALLKQLGVESSKLFEDAKKNRDALQNIPQKTERYRFERDSVQSNPGRIREGLGVTREIAIVGLSGRYPMASNLDEFWNNLKSGLDCITEIPVERWDYSKYFDLQKGKQGKTYSKWGGFIDDVDKFDPMFFNISPREAKTMDPQERLFLQTVWHAFEDAGYTRARLAGKDIGVFVGAMYSQYQMLGADETMIEGGLPTSTFSSIANRVSYFFDLRGPSLAVDTMCSSALTALHLACKSLINGECAMAVAGGVNITIHQNKYLILSQGNFTASDGRCRAFGEGGDGYVPGEGVGAVILKPLDTAVRDKDHIYAVIKGSLLNHGGKTNGYTVPNPNAQADLIERSLRYSGVNPRTISYVEAHGTGTSLGDPIEITGLIKSYEVFTTDKQYCKIGSVKSNIGHLESAAGIAGLTKILLQMKHKMLVPSIHTKTLNPNIDFKNSPFEVQRQLEEWKRPVIEEGREKKEYPRIAALSSFGAGGSNAHFIIQEWEEKDSRSNHQDTGEHVIVLSAKNEERLRVYAGEIADFIKKAFIIEEGPDIKNGLDESVKKEITKTVSEITNIDMANLVLNDSFEEMGFDQVMLVRLVESINEKLKLDLKASIFKECHTLDSFINYLLSRYSQVLENVFNKGLSGYQKTENQMSLTLEDMAYTLQMGREAMEERLAVVTEGFEDLEAKLRAFASEGKLDDNVFRGSSRKGQSRFRLFDEDEDFGVIINKWAAGGKYTKLSELWAGGVNLDWSIVNKGRGRIISLPGYPFAKERCWVTVVPSRKNGESLNTRRLLGDLDYKKVIEKKKLIFTKEFTGAEPVLNDHIVNDKAVLPGAAQLETVFEAASKVMPDQNVSITNVVWLNPLSGDNVEVQTSIELKESSGKMYFEISINNGRIVCSKGELIREKSVGNAKQVISIHSIKERCNNLTSQKELYSLFENIGIKYGRYYRTVKEIWGSGTEALGVLEHDASNISSEDGDYIIHPAILDGALQTMAGVGEIHGRTMLPFSVDKVECIKPVNTKAYAYVRKDGEDRFNVAILDENGNVCVKLHGVSVRELKTSERHTDFYYIPQWRYKPLQKNKTVETASSETCLLIYAPEEKDLVDIFKKAYSGTVVTIEMNAKTEKVSANHWQIDLVDMDGYKNILKEIRKVDCIYFMGGINRDDRNTGDANALEVSQQKGIISFFRLIKALISEGFGNSNICFKVITNRVFDIYDDEKIIPYGAELYGFCKSLSKEYPCWNIACIDINLGDERASHEELEATVKCLMDEWGTFGGSEIAIRYGRRYIRELYPANLPAVDGISIKNNGVYIILGGAGGIGTELSCYLAKTVKARLALIGRSGLDDRKKAVIAKIEAMGGKVLYIQADASNLQSMADAVSRVKEHFGRIDGVVHSAIVLKDRMVENMDEKTLKEVLAPKVMGSIALFKALENENPDFVLFFSSAQSFSGNAGQSNYAAACTFKDAYAKSLANRVSYPVRIINWGYWGSVGVVASENYNRRLAAMGVMSIQTDEGMEAVRRILGNPAVQVMPLKAETKVLNSLGIDLENRIEVFTEKPGFRRCAIPDITKQPVLEQEVLTNFLKAFDSMNSFGRYAIMGVFNSMGAFMKEGERYNTIDLMKKLRIIPKYSRLYTTILKMIQKEGFVKIEEQIVTTLKKAEEYKNRFGFDELEKRKDSIISLNPVIEAHMKLLWTCILNFSSIIRGERLATEIIFPNSSMELLEGIYKKNVTADYYNSLVVWSLKALLESRPGEKIKILEVGAGTGGTSAAVFQALRGFKNRMEYTYTDISSGFINYGKKRFGSENDYVRFSLLNIENDIVEQGYVPGTYDAVIATNVLHATKSIHNTVDKIKALLKNRGMLIVNEATEAHEFTNLTFGLLDGWWLYSDADCRLEGSPLLGKNMWERLLTVEGFRNVEILGENGSGQNVIVAESDGIIRIKNTLKKTGSPVYGERKKLWQEAGQETVSDVSRGEKTSIMAKTASSKKDKAIIEECIKQSLSQVLQIDGTEFDVNIPYTDFGVDSVLAVDIISKINNSLNISLRSTDLFNYSTISRLTAYIEEEFEINAEFGKDIRNGEVFQTQKEELDIWSKEGEVRSVNKIGTSGSRKEYLTEISDIRTCVIYCIKQSLSDVLQIDGGEFDVNVPYTDFGVDSVLAIEIINKINERLDIQLRGTDLFNYSTIKSLAEYIEETFGSNIKVEKTVNNIEPDAENLFSSVGDAKYEESVSYVTVENQVDPKAVVSPVNTPSIKSGGKPCSENKNNGLGLWKDIAIVGVSCRFPDADNAEEFWCNLESGRDSVKEITRWDDSEYYDPHRKDVNKGYCKWMGGMDGIDSFDPLFFNISPKEAELMDPQQRIFLMETWRALEDAGYSDKELADKKCGVFVGCGPGDYDGLLEKYGVAPEAYAFMGNDESILAARASYFLNLKGPSVAVNTACSSSLVAIHLACESIMCGTSEIAVAGGVALLVTPRLYILGSRAGMLSPDGKCKAFDNSANGFVPGEGVGVVVLKSLEDALKDGNHIYGVIKGTGINQDGKTNGITAPSAPSQTALELEVYRKYGINPANISYIEAHGTGTKLGDPIEITALTDSFGKYTQDKQFCAIGSVKTNIGHALPAAGVAGLIKVLMCLKYKKLVPSLHLKKENEHINFKDSPFYVNTVLCDWKCESGRLRQAAISSFGFSGTNSHIVVEEAPVQEVPKDEEGDAYHLFLVSAKTHKSYTYRLEELLEWLENKGGNFSLQNVSYTLNAGRSHFNVRGAFLANNRETLINNIKAVLDGRTVSDYWFKTVSTYGEEHTVDGDLYGQIDRDALIRLAQGYVNGNDYKWKALYKEGCRLITMPVYPFEDRSYWVKGAPKPTGGKQPRGVGILNHPLLDKVEKIGADSERYLFTKVLDNDRVVQDHKVKGMCVLPGAAYLEMVCAAVSHLNGSFTERLKDVVWIRPLFCSDKKELELFMEDESSQLSYTVSSMDKDEKVVHSRGKIELYQGKNVLPERLDIKGIIDRCTGIIERDDLYNYFEGAGLEYGSYFRTLTRVMSGNGEAIGFLRNFEGKKEGHILHPGMLDGALQTIVGLKYGAGESVGPVMPFSLEKAEVYLAIPQEAYAYVKTVGNDRYDIGIIDGQGNMCVKISGITLRPVKEKNVDFVYEPLWKSEEVINVSKPVKPVEGKVVVLQCGSYKIIIDKIKEIYGTGNVIEAKIGTMDKEHDKEGLFLNIEHPESVEQFIGNIKNIKSVYFIGIQENERDLDNISYVEQSEQEGVITFFRLLKALYKYGYSDKDISLRVITNDVLCIRDGDKIKPFFAGLHGLAGSLAKERPNWSVGCFDISLSGNVEAEAEIAISEPAAVNGSVIGIRNGRKYTRIFRHINPEKEGGNPFKKEGVYFIVGGAGGIGLELSLHLARNKKAKLILIGRSEPDKKCIQNMDRIIEAGGEYLYIKTDICNYESVKKAVLTAKERFGRIDGVVHSAIVLRDGAIENMNEKTLKSVLQPKTRGSAVLYRAFKNENIDFMMFFSSIQSFTCNAGQSNYASASTFEDAYALALRENGKIPVRIINWGYWGSVGVVASEDYKKRMAANGVYSISPDEGMKVIECLLESNLRQIMAVKAEKSVLKAMGTDFGQEINTKSGEPIQESMAFLLKNQPLLEKSELESLHKGFEELIDFGRCLLFNAFNRMGVFTTGNESYSIEELFNITRITSEYRRLFNALLSILENAGLVRVEGDYVSASDRAYMQAAKGRAELESVKKELILRYPEIGSHIRLLWECLKDYPDILKGVISATDVIFPESSMELVEGIYKGNKLSDYYNSLISWSLVYYIENSLNKLRKGEKIRIIEIGAGTGGTSAPVLNAIKRYKNYVDYIYTDISAAFTRYGKNKYGSDNPFVQFKLLNIEEDIAKQGYTPGEFDISISTNVLHATKDISKTLGNVNKLLKTGGWAIINEATAVHEFATLTFGLLEGWWLYEDGDLRLEHSPILAADTWKSILLRQGFDKAVVLGENGMGQNVIISEKNLDKEAELANTYLKPNIDMDKLLKSVTPENNDIFQEELVLKVESVIISSIESVLGVEASQISMDKQFSEYGIDSISGLDLVALINDKLGIALKTTVLFDYSNVRVLVDYIIKEYEQKLRSVLTAEKSADIQAASVNAEEKQAISDFELELFVIRIITECMENILGVNPEDVTDEKQFTDYGVDSISGLDLINKINAELGIVLKTTVLFDYPNVSALAKFITDRFEKEITETQRVLTQPAAGLDGNRESGNGTHDELEILKKLALGELEVNDIINIWEE